MAEDETPPYAPQGDPEFMPDLAEGGEPPCWNCGGSGRFTLVVRDFVDSDGTPQPTELNCPFCREDR